MEVRICVVTGRRWAGGCQVFLAVALALWSVARPAQARRVVVHKGEWVLRIVRREVGGPVFGPKGTLHQVARLNPQIADPNVVVPGDYVYLPSPTGQRVGNRRKKRQRTAARPPAAPSSPTPPAAPPAAAAAPVCPPCPECKPGVASAFPQATPTAIVRPDVAAPLPAHGNSAWDLRATVTITPSKILSQDLQTGGRLQVGTLTSAGLALRANASWADFWLARLQVDGRLMGYRPQEASGFALDNPAATLAAAQVAVGIAPINRLRLLLTSRAEQVVSLGARSTRRAVLDVNAVLGAGLQLELTAWQTATWRLDLDLFATILGSRGQAAAGKKVGGDIELSWAASPHLALLATLGYQQRIQGTPLTTQSEVLWGLGAGARWQP